MPHSPGMNKSGNLTIDENANIDDRNKSPFNDKRSPAVSATPSSRSADQKRIDKIAETLRTVTGNKNYFEHTSSNKSYNMIPHSPPTSLTLKPPTFPSVANFPGHFLSDDSINRTPENLLFDTQSQMHGENLCTDSMMDKPAMPKPSNPKLYATCFICNKKLSNQYNLRVHLETHQNMRYACQVCNHVSRSKDALRKVLTFFEHSFTYSVVFKK